MRQLGHSVFLTWAEMTSLTADDRVSSLKALRFFENMHSVHPGLLLFHSAM